MTKAEILTLCTSLSLDLEDDSTISTFFDDVIDDLAQLTMPPFVSGSFIEIAENVDEYAFPSTCLRLLHLIMTDKSITECSEDDISAYSTLWRGDLDTPLAFTQESLSREFRLYPTPDNDSTALAPGATDQLGADFVAGWIYAFYAEDRSTEMPDYLSIPVALLSLSKAFSMYSNFQDSEFADQCDQLARLFLTILRH